VVEPVARIRIELRGLEPKIWRRVDVPLSATLDMLHEIIQVAMRWRGGHLFEFRVGDKVYGEPCPEDDFEGYKVHKATSVRLQNLVNRGVERFLYVYDFGDNWQHDITIEAVFDGLADTEYPALVDGARRCPPDDVGSAHGFMDFLEAILDPAHEEHARMLEWYGGPFDVRDFEERWVRLILGSMAGRRRGGLAKSRGRRRQGGPA